MWASIKGMFSSSPQHTELLQTMRDMKQQLAALSSAHAATHTAIQTLLAQQRIALDKVITPNVTAPKLVQGGGVLSSALQAATVQFSKAVSPGVPAARKPSTPHPNKATRTQQHNDFSKPSAAFAHPRAVARAGAVSARTVTFSAAVAPSRVESPSSAGSWKSVASLNRRQRRRGTPAPAAFKAQVDTSASQLDTSGNSAPRSPTYNAAPPSPLPAPQFGTSMLQAASTSAAAPAGRAPHPLMAAGLGPGALLGARAQLKRAPRAAPKPRAGVRKPAIGLAGIAAAAAAMAERRSAPKDSTAVPGASDAGVNASTWSSPGLGRPAVTPCAKLRLVAPSGPKAFPALAGGAATAAAAAAPRPVQRAAPVGGVKRSWADIARVQQRTARPAARLPPPPTAALAAAHGPARAALPVQPQPAKASPPTIRGFGAADLLAAKRGLKSGSKAPRAASRERARSNPRGPAAALGGKSSLQSVLTAALARRFAHANPSPVQRAGKAARGSSGTSPASSVASSWDGSDVEGSPAQQRSKRVVTLASRPAVVARGSPLRQSSSVNAATPVWRKAPAPVRAGQPARQPQPAARRLDSPKVAGVSIRPVQRVEALLSPVRMGGMAYQSAAARQVR